MQIYLNDRPLVLDEQTSLKSLMNREYPASQVGIAVAINASVVSSSKWESTVLKDGDKVMVIGAAFGG